MEYLALKILNMSIVSGWVILAVILLRALLKKAPKQFVCALWAFVGIRLIVPFSLKSAVSLIPSVEILPQNFEFTKDPGINTGIGTVNDIVNPAITDAFSSDIGINANGIRNIFDIAVAAWLVGIAAFTAYALISYLQMRLKLRTAVLTEDNIWKSASVDSPFVLGIVRPKIYLPFTLEESEARYAIAHEKAHIARHDSLIKALAFALTVVYWFNPLVWIAYILLCRDIEMACDERVIKNMSVEERKQYSSALLSCSTDYKTLFMAFGEIGIKGRIKSVLNYKKPTFWIAVLSVAAILFVGVFLMTDPQNKTDELVRIVPTSHHDVVFLTPYSSLSPDYFLQNQRKNEIKAQENLFAIKNEDGDYLTYCDDPIYKKETIRNNSIESGFYTLDVSPFKDKNCYSVYDKNGEDTGYRIFIMDSETWLGHWDWYGGNHNYWECDYIITLPPESISTDFT